MCIMKNLLLFTLCLGVLAIFTGCTIVNNNKGTSDNLPAAIARPAYYQAITEIGEKPVSAEVTGNLLFKTFRWGIPFTFAANASFSGSMVEPFDFAGMTMSSGGISLSPISFDPYDAFKKAAAYRACEENGCDSLMDARFVITRNYYVIFEVVTCKVSGIPVKVTGYKLITCPHENCNGTCQKTE